MDRRTRTKWEGDLTGGPLVHCTGAPHCRQRSCPCYSAHLHKYDCGTKKRRRFCYHTDRHVFCNVRVFGEFHGRAFLRAPVSTTSGQADADGDKLSRLYGIGRLALYRVIDDRHNSYVADDRMAYAAEITNMDSDAVALAATDLVAGGLVHETNMFTIHQLDMRDVETADTL